MGKGQEREDAVLLNRAVISHGSSIARRLRQRSRRSDERPHDLANGPEVQPLQVGFHLRCPRQCSGHSDGVDLDDGIVGTDEEKIRFGS